MADTLKRSIAAAEVLMIFPAMLFMTALFVRNIQPQQFEPAHTAERIVTWYATSGRAGLWLFLIALPIAVLMVGSGTLLRHWKDDSELRLAARQTIATVRDHFAVLLITAATGTAAVVLAIVGLHVLTD